jgi:hypothetical protein
LSFQKLKIVLGSLVREPVVFRPGQDDKNDKKLFTDVCDPVGIRLRDWPQYKFPKENPK